MIPEKISTRRPRRSRRHDWGELASVTLRVPREKLFLNSRSNDPLNHPHKTQKTQNN
jgi:hypothetical protein